MDIRIPLKETIKYIETDNHLVSISEHKILNMYGKQNGLKLISLLSGGEVKLPNNFKIDLYKCHRSYEEEIVNGETFVTTAGDNYHIDLYNGEELAGEVAYRINNDVDVNGHIKNSIIEIENYKVNDDENRDVSLNLLVEFVAEIGKATKCDAMRLSCWSQEDIKSLKILENCKKFADEDMQRHITDYVVKLDEESLVNANLLKLEKFNEAVRER